VSNRIADPDLPGRLRHLLRDSLLGLLSEQASLTHPSVPQLFRNVCDHCDLGLGTLMRLATGRGAADRRKIRELLAHRVKRIVVKPFMDLDTMIEERLQQCCVHVGAQGADGSHQCVPFCAMQAWPALTDTRLSGQRPGGQEPVVMGRRSVVPT